MKRHAINLLVLLACFASSCKAQQPQQPPAEAARQKEAKAFVEHYFRTWSQQQMDAYSDCFLNEATIQFIDDKGELATQLKSKFVAGQRAMQGPPRTPSTETPESIDIRLEAKLARAVVYWKLVSGPRTEYGYDHFTLVKQNGTWKILNLVFYEVPPPANR